ncbi:MAG: cyclic lactone autoinducer peptide [Syntrophomonas sp.]
MKGIKNFVITAASSALKKTARYELSTATPCFVYQPKAPKSLSK